MNATTAKFTFSRTVPMPDVEATLRLAILACESLHGEDRVRLETYIRTARAMRAVEIDTASDVGRTLAIVFGGYVRREFGEEAFEIERFTPADLSSTAGVRP